MRQTKRVLVTGGAGFIGSNLSKALLTEGACVDCVDNLVTGRIESIQPLRSLDRFRFFRLDVTDPSFFNAALTTRYDEIYHLACPTGVPNIKTLGEEMIRACSIGTEQVLQVASAHNAKVLFASSAEVYGDPVEFPQTEAYFGNVNPVGPRSAYEEGKRFGESLMRLYAEKYDVDAKIVRIFNTFGVGMRPDDTRLIPSFMRRVREHKSLIVYGDGAQTRTHLYVADLISALRLVIRKGEKGEAYNIGGEQQLSVLDLVEILKNLVAVRIEVEHLPHFIEDHGGRLPKTAKVKALSWRPRVDIEEGLRRMLVSFGIPTRRPNKSAPMSTPKADVLDRVIVPPDA